MRANAQAFPGDLGGEVSEEDAALDDDRNRRQRHADGGDTDRIRVGLVSDQSIVRVGFVQIVKNRGQLQQTQLLLAGRRSRSLSAPGVSATVVALGQPNCTRTLWVFRSSLSGSA